MVFSRSEDWRARISSLVFKNLSHTVHPESSSQLKMQRGADLRRLVLKTSLKFMFPRQMPHCPIIDRSSGLARSKNVTREKGSALATGGPLGFKRPWGNTEFLGLFSWLGAPWMCNICPQAPQRFSFARTLKGSASQLCLSSCSMTWWTPSRRPGPEAFGKSWRVSCLFAPCISWATSCHNLLFFWRLCRRLT